MTATRCTRLASSWGVPKLGLSLEFQREFAARDRFAGNALTFTFALPLDVIARKVFSAGS